MTCSTFKQLDRTHYGWVSTKPTSNLQTFLFEMKVALCGEAVFKKFCVELF